MGGSLEEDLFEDFGDEEYFVWGHSFFFFSLLLFALFSRGFIWCGLLGFCVIRGLGGALLGLGMDGCRAVFWGYMGRTEDKDTI